ncbi:hypothetical protein LB505_000176 [Fusarium chuoi]|nr:hypothetical protein LB505_000176 [Fusarium chuoi]
MARKFFVGGNFKIRPSRRLSITSTTLISTRTLVRHSSVPLPRASSQLFIRTPPSLLLPE